VTFNLFIATLVIYLVLTHSYRGIRLWMLEQRLKELDERVTNVHRRVCHQEHMAEHSDAYWHTWRQLETEHSCCRQTDLTLPQQEDKDNVS